jgi:predicted AAA+ superfamily ATPase
MYVHREIEDVLSFMLGQGKVVLVTGARQVGKTTMLRHTQLDGFGYASLENPGTYAEAKRDPLLFFDAHPIPIIVDEVQRVPELFGTVKYLVDESGERGQVILTGSQTYHLMKGVSESLAGRIRILEMAGLSLREVTGLSGGVPYVPSRVQPESLASPPKGFDLWPWIQRGSMPELRDPGQDWDGFYSAYVSAYLERDVRDLINVHDEAKFYSFMVACAARTGQLVNTKDIADVVEVDHKTVQSWISVLQASGVVRILRPFWSNADKRLAKTPKLYFMDTGLACYLTRWTTPEALRNGAMSGHMFETFVVSEVLKSYMNAGRNVRDVWFYRDSRKREIDLVIQEGHVLHPVEVKMGFTVGTDAIKHFSALDSLTGYEVGEGSVICQTKEPYLIARDVQAVPVWAI